MKGLFVTFEGVEGCGKSTQIRLLEQRLREEGHKVLVTREPGGNPIAEAIREILLDPENMAMGPTAELLLYAAARAQHVHQTIRPALEEGAIVLCDRFADSTTAYQGAARGIPEATLQQLHELATGGLKPDITFLLDIPVEAGLERTRQRGRADRIEQESLEFHERVRQGFLKIADQEPERVQILDASESVDTVAESIHARVARRTLLLDCDSVSPL